MLRWIVGFGRKAAIQKEAEVATAEGKEETEETEEMEEEEPEPLEDEGELEEAGPIELEDWVDFVRRSTGMAEEAMKKVKLEDWVAGQRRRKWRWAGHAARRKDHRWSNRILHCIGMDGSRRAGHPKTRWRDAIEAFVNMQTTRSGSEWMDLAQDGKAWKALEDKFVQRCQIGRQ